MPSDPTRYLPLDNYLLTPPLPIFIGLILLLGIVGFGRIIAHRIKSKPEPLEYAAGFILANGAIGLLLHTLALLGSLNVWLVRGIGLTIAAIGIWQAWQWRTAPRQLWQQWETGYRQSDWLNRIALLCITITIIALFFAALGPATDGDSMDYHLGVPLDWLNNGGATIRYDWLHARLIGLGEMQTLLGLAMGTDNLGALTQFAGLIIAIIAVQKSDFFKKSDFSNTLLSTLLITACPVILFLVPNQKPQYLPAVATLVAIVLIVRRAHNVDRATLIFAFGSAAYAMGCKYTSLLAGGVVILLGLWVAYRCGKLRQAIIIAGAFGIFFVAAIWIRNWVYYDDPLSPFLEATLGNDDLMTIAFGDHLQEYGAGERTITNLLRLPVALTITLSPSLATTVLGLGTLAFLFALPRSASPRPHISPSHLLLAAGIVTILQITLSQWTPRFFLEPYLWCAAAVGLTVWNFPKRLYLAALTAQGIGVTLMALFAAVTIFPGALTPTLRQQVVERAAAGAQLGNWIDSVTPPDAIVYVEARTMALFQRPALSYDVTRYWDQVEMDVEPLREIYRETFVTFLQDHDVTHLVLRDDLTRFPYREWDACLGEVQAGPYAVIDAARNPFNRAEARYNYVLVQIDADNC